MRLRKFLRSVIRILSTVGAIIFLVWIVFAQPSFHRNPTSKVTIDPDQLKKHVETLASTFYPRNFQHPENLDRCANYIAQHFERSGALVEFQPFTVAGRSFRNVIARFHAGHGSKVIVGAHYDACGETPGADDNASGVSSLIELAYLLGHNPPADEVELVAYCLEEPPFFKTELMGSAIHAKSVTPDKAHIRGVIVLEMVGFFQEEWGSQSYPMPLLYLLYPNRANFIGVISQWDQGDWIKKVKSGMKGCTDLPVYSIRAPSVIPGIDFSDHINYWPYGIPSLMITDTAFLRSMAYHTLEDTPDRLDYPRMAQVVISVFEALGHVR